MLHQLTSAQQESLRRDVDLAITAGAGTGKTRVLVDRYLEILLADKADVRSILAVTFTNKAAAEMLERIAVKLDDLLTSPSSTQQSKSLTDIRNRLSSAYISTIHAFCTRLLREFPLHAGIDPDFSVLNELQAELILTEAVKAEFESLNEDPQHWADLFRLLGSRTIESMLREALPHRYALEEIGAFYINASAEELEKTANSWFESYASESFPEQAVTEITASARAVLESGRTASKSDTADKIFKLLQQFVLTQNKDWVLFFEIINWFTNSEGNAYKTTSKLGKNKAWVNPDTLLNLSHTASLISDRVVSAPGATSQSYALSLQRFFQLFGRLKQRYQDLKLNRNVLDFEDLQIFAVHLLQVPDIRNQMQRQFKFIMVDEFQDTNLLQYKIVELLHNDAGNNLFVVGDPKQSIYGFRNADVRVFTRLLDEFKTKDDAETVLLAESFRFKRNLTDFYNEVFPHIFSDTTEWGVSYQEITAQRKDPEEGGIELGLFEHETNRQVQTAYICEKIKKIAAEGTYQYGNIAVLLRTRTHLTDLEETLRAYQIPFQTIGGIGFYQRQEIYDIYHLIRFLIDPYDDIALIGLLRSPFAHVSDEGLFFLAVRKDQASYWDQLHQIDLMEQIPNSDRKNITRFRKLATKWYAKKDRIGFYELLNEIFNESTYAGIMAGTLQGERLLANIQKVTDLARQYESSGFLSLNDFANLLHNFINRETQEGEAWIDTAQQKAVTVMTIHQAKGLEFPVIFVPFLEQKIKRTGNAGIYIDEKFGIGAPIRRNQSHFLNDLLKKRSLEKELAEYKRIFYVACTRARDQLYLSAEIKNEPPKNTPLSWLIEALDIDLKQSKPKENVKGVRLRCHAPGEIISVAKTIEKSIKKLKQMGKISTREELPATLQLTKDSPKGETFSATQIMTYLQDKDEYYRRYFLGYFEGDYDRLLLEPTGEDMALLKGKIIHRYLETYPDFNLQEILLEYEIADHRIQSLLEEELMVVQKRITGSDVLKQILNAKPYKTEVTIFMKLGADYITGTLDRMYQTEENNWQIIDYKTNRVTKTGLNETAERYTTQSETYALLLSYLYPHQNRYCINFYFIYPDEIISKTYTTAQTIQLAEKFRATLTEMKKIHEINSAF
jgi:ATP-dependent helicase/nuclease subunit A